MPSYLQQPLSEQERASLSGPALAGGAAPISLAERILENFTVDGRAWSGGSWRGARLHGVHFIACSFVGVDLTDAVFEGVVFERCTLTACRYLQTVFEGCRFVDSSVAQGIARGTALRDCRFEAGQLASLVFEEALLERTRFSGSALQELRFSECKLDALEFTSVSARAVRWSYCEGGAHVFRSCQMDQVSFLGGSFAVVSLREGSWTNTSFVEVEAEGLVLEQLGFVRRLNVTRCKLHRWTVARCPRLLALYASDSQLGQLQLRESRLEGTFARCTLGPGSVVEAATLVGVFWDETEAHELSFQRVTFEEAICARGARFFGMKLRDVRYGPDLALLLEGATFEASDRFVEGSHG